MNSIRRITRNKLGNSALLMWLAAACIVMIPGALLAAQELEPTGNGAYPVGTTNMRMIDDFHGFGDEWINAYLSGHFDENVIGLSLLTF